MARMKSAIVSRRKPQSCITDKIDTYDKALRVTWWALAVAVLALIVVLPVLGGAFLLLNQQNRLGVGRPFVSGLLMGLGLLMKQPALFFVLFGASYLFLGDFRAGLVLRKAIQRSLVFSGGAVTPLVITFLTLLYAGVCARFWFWILQ